MKIYAIRERSTAKYLPALKPNGRARTRGFSHTEPCEQSPRLFHTKRSAQNALSAWLQGQWNNVETRGGFYGDDYDCYPEPTPIPSRRREAMEVVEFELQESAA